jgi:hypothetical protein
MIFGVCQGACLSFKHHWDTVSDRKGKPITPTNEFRMVRVWIEPTLAKWADKKVK